ncbi:MAG: type III pantothenate kinase [Candidatus Omnitrophica bacterium]|nr:type III pantothenate kinase [Candidatus Omnitrophota bacterium]
MILAVDIGNTTIGLGVCEGTRVLSACRLDTVAGKRPLAAAVSKHLWQIRRRYPSLRDAVICSVVPRALAAVEATLRRQFGGRVVVLGRDLPVPIKNNYRDPRQVGQDRLVGAYAAKCLYGAPCLIIDFGTAITFDVVSRRGEYEGGLIIPGLRLSAESLFQKTALLPRVDRLRAPRSLIGKDTRESILSGLFNGYGAMCRGLIDRVAAQTRGKPRVIVTGGHTDLMKKFIREKIHKVDPDLVFKGIELVSRRQSSR